MPTKVVLLTFCIFAFASSAIVGLGGLIDRDRIISPLNPLTTYTPLNPLNTLNPLTRAFPVGLVNILGDNGRYLARCRNCGVGTYTEPASLFETDGSRSWARWAIQRFGDKYAFRSDIGSYLGRCDKCWGNSLFSHAAFIHEKDCDSKPWALWTPIPLRNGRWAFRADNGKYLARCVDCVFSRRNNDFAFVHVDSYDFEFAQWTVNLI